MKFKTTFQELVKLPFVDKHKLELFSDLHELEGEFELEGEPVEGYDWSHCLLHSDFDGKRHCITKKLHYCPLAGDKVEIEWGDSDVHPIHRGEIEKPKKIEEIKNFGGGFPCKSGKTYVPSYAQAHHLFEKINEIIKHINES